MKCTGSNCECAQGMYFPLMFVLMSQKSRKQSRTCQHSTANTNS